jgi:hypothetical protein
MQQLPRAHVFWGRQQDAKELYVKGSEWDEQGTVKSSRGSSKVSLLACHTCVETLDESRDFSLVDNTVSVLNLSKLFSVNHKNSSL